jgi:hypothetical protein
MDWYIKENGCKIKEKVKEDKSIVMEIHTMECGIMI